MCLEQSCCDVAPRRLVLKRALDARRRGPHALEVAAMVEPEAVVGHRLIGSGHKAADVAGARASPTAPEHRMGAAGG